MYARSPEGTRTQILELEELKDLRRQSILPPKVFQSQNRKQDRPLN